MITQEHDRLLSAYLSGDIDDVSFTLVDELLRNEPAAGARLLELAAVELMLLAAPRELSERRAAEGGQGMVKSEPASGSPTRREEKVIAFPAVARRKQRQAPVLGASTIEPPARRGLLWLSMAAAVALALFFNWQAQSGSKVAGMVEMAHGSVRLTRAAKSPAAVEGRTVLHSGDRIETGPDGRCEARFSGESTVIRVGPESRLVVDLAASGGKVVRLEAGKIDATVAPQRHAPMLVKTANAVATVLGTQFTLATLENRTAIQVTHGQVRFSDPQTHQFVEVAHSRLAMVSSETPLQLVSPEVGGSVEKLLAKPELLQGRTLVHDWAFEDEITDAAGSLTASGVNLKYAPGQAGKTLDVTTAGGFMTARTVLPERFEICFWIRLPNVAIRSDGDGFKRTIICNSESGYTRDGFRLLAYVGTGDPGSLRLETADGSISITARSAPGCLPREKWNYVSVRIDRIACDARFFVNEVDRTSSQKALQPSFGYIAPLSVGMTQSGTYPLRGMLDELQIYALSAEAAKVPPKTPPHE